MGTYEGDEDMIVLVDTEVLYSEVLYCPASLSTSDRVEYSYSYIVANLRLL